MVSLVVGKSALVFASVTCFMAASLVTLATPSAQAVPKGSHTVPKVLLHCDDTAKDAKVSNDCIQTIAIGDAADGRTTGGKLSKIAVTIAPELRGKSLLGEVQYRSVYNNGSRGKWWTHRTIVWHAKDTKINAMKTFEACAPAKAGRYETRTLLAVPVSKETKRTRTSTAKTNRARAFDSATASPTPSTQVTSTTTPSSAAATPTASVTPSKSATPVASASASTKPTSSASSTASASATPTTKPSASPTTTASTQVTQAPYTTSDAIAASSVSSLAVTQSAPLGSCSNFAEDELLIEYFNQLNFEQSFQIQKTDTGATLYFQITCPSAPSASFPGPDFHLTLTAMDGSMSTNCISNQPISVNKAQAKSGGYNFCTGNICTFTVVYSNATTGTVYSTTVIHIALTNGTQAIIPNLNPATLPVCNNTLNACLLSGTCSLSNSKEGALSLCSSAANCTTAPPTNTGGYSYNMNVYFQTLVTNK